MIISGLKEQQKLQNKKKKLAEEILKEMDLSDTEVRSVKRLRVVRNDKKRILKLEIRDSEEKWNFIGLAKAFRSSEFTNVYVNSDRTFLQQNEKKQFLEEMRQRKGNGENVAIRRKVVNNNEIRNFQ